MTSIVAYTDHGVPCMLGDLLVSSQIKPTDELLLPVSGKSSSENPILWDTHYYTSLVQKLNVISPHLIVGWADSRLEAKVAIAEIRKKYNEIQPSSYSQIIEVLEIISNLDFKNLSMAIGIQIDRTWGVSHFGPGARRFSTPWGEEGVIAGTGKDAILDAMRINYNFEGSNPFEISSTRLMGTAARMWYWDVAGFGPQNAFGGGYEVATRRLDCIEKISDILYVSCNFSKENGLTFDPIFKKVDYWNNMMVLRVLEFSVQQDGYEFEYKRAATYLVPPVDQDWKAEPPPSQELLISEIPSYDATHVFTHVQIANDSRGSSSAIVKLDYNKQDGPFIFEYERESGLPVQITIENSYIDNLNERISATLSRK